MKKKRKRIKIDFYESNECQSCENFDKKFKCDHKRGQKSILWVCIESSNFPSPFYPLPITSHNAVNSEMVMTIVFVVFMALRHHSERFSFSSSPIDHESHLNEILSYVAQSEDLCFFHCVCGVGKI